MSSQYLDTFATVAAFVPGGQPIAAGLSAASAVNGGTTTEGGSLFGGVLSAVVSPFTALASLFESGPDGDELVAKDCERWWTTEPFKSAFKLDVYNAYKAALERGGLSDTKASKIKDVLKCLESYFKRLEAMGYREVAIDGTVAWGPDSSGAKPRLMRLEKIATTTYAPQEAQDRAMQSAVVSYTNTATPSTPSASAQAPASASKPRTPEGGKSNTGLWIALGAAAVGVGTTYAIYRATRNKKKSKAKAA